MRSTRLAAALLAATLAACSPPDGATPGTAAPADTAPAPAAAATAAEWNAFVERFIEAHLVANPAEAVTLGRHEFDGRLPDWSRAGLDAEVARLKALRTEASAFGDDRLDATQRFQRDYLLSRIDAQLFWLDTAQWPYRNPAFYGALDPAPYVTLTYAPPAQRLQAVTTYLRNVPAAAAQIRDNLDDAPLPPSYVQLGLNTFGGLADFYDSELPKAFADVDDAAVQQAFEDARGPAIEAMRGLHDWLEGERDTATGDFALGAEHFSAMLRATEGVELDLATLKAAGEADMQRNLAALATECAEYAPGASLRDCMAKMNANKPEGGSVQAARAQLGGLEAFVREHDLVSIPSTDVAEVDEAPTYARWNFAYINIPGPYEKGQPAVYYIAPPDPAWSAAAQRDYVPGEKNLLFTSVHEVWPGHFLNFLHAKRSDFPFGRIFVGYAYAEGWAHYTEEMMWDAGLGDGDAETHIGQLSNALLRNARYLSAIGLHTGGMTLEQSKALFMEGALQDEGTAMQQAARGTFDPAYLNYTLGKLMITQLREDWTATRGGREAWKAFHDGFLAYGGPPIPLVRAQMLGGPAETKLWTPGADAAAATGSSDAAAAPAADAAAAASEAPAAPASE